MMQAMFNSRLAVFMIIVTGMLLLFSTVATLVAVVEVRGEVDESRKLACQARALNDFQNPPGCKEYVDVDK